MRAGIISLVAFICLSFSSILTIAHAQNISEDQAIQAQTVISDQLSAFLDGDGKRAFSHAAPTIKQRFQSPEQFMTMVERGYGPIYRSSTYDFGRHTLKGDQIVQELILSDKKGNTWQSIYVLKRQSDGTLKIMGVQMRRSENSIL